MRMWMLNPKQMCRKHLLGEHVECHMILGSMKKGHSLNGFAEKNCLELASLISRHTALADEIISRGYNHRSPLDAEAFQVHRYRYADLLDVKVDRKSSEQDLRGRCKECRV